MIVNIYNEHIAYVFEQKESVYALGQKLINKMNNDVLMKSYMIKYNGCKKLLYDTSEFKKLSETVSMLSEAELISMLKKLASLIVELDENDYLDKIAVDINFQNIYYSPKEHTLKCAMLPVNEMIDFHDGISWQEKFRYTVVMLCRYIFATQPDKYSEVYYKTLDYSISDAEIAKYFIGYDYGLTSVMTNEQSVEFNPNNENTRVLILEHDSNLGNIIFRITQKEFLLGKSVKNADGVIGISQSISRKHCLIRRIPEGFTVEDVNSVNGTRINGYKIQSGQQYMINNGDLLQLADIVFVVNIG